MLGRLIPLLLFFSLLVLPSAHAEVVPVLVGFDSERGHAHSTSDEAIRTGIRLAMEEINAAGGVLNGRPLELVEKDHRSVPARGVQNIEEFAAIPNLVAVFCGKFSPVVLEELPILHRLRLPMLDPWAAATGITDHGFQPSYTFRLSLRDDGAVKFLLQQGEQRKILPLGMLLPNNAWGRSVRNAAQELAHHRQDIVVDEPAWYNWGDTSLLTAYLHLVNQGAKGILLASNEKEGALLIQEMAELPENKRLPILSHWGVSGGPMAEMAGEAMNKVDFTVVQTFSFLHRETELSRRVSSRAMNLLGVNSVRALPSVVGLAHAYDLTHLLARAIHKANSMDRNRIRDALESLEPYEGLTPMHRPPFTPERHDAFQNNGLFMARFALDGALIPLSP